MLPGLMMPLPHSKFLTCRLTWAAMHSAACFQAVRLSLQGLTQVTRFRSAMLPGLMMPLLLLPRRPLRPPSWLLRRLWKPQGLKLRLRMWAAPAGAPWLRAVRLSLQGLTQVTWFRSAMLPGLRMPQGLKLRLRMWAAPSGLTMPLPDSKFLTCRLTWAAMRSAACFQAVRLSLQGLTQVT